MLNKIKLIMCILSVSVLASLSSSSLAEDVFAEQPTDYVTNQPEPNSFVLISEDFAKKLIFKI